MSGTARGLIGAMILGACAVGAISHWRSRNSAPKSAGASAPAPAVLAPVVAATESAREVAAPAGQTVAETPAEAPAKLELGTPPIGSHEVFATLTQVIELTKANDRDRALELASHLVAQLEPLARSRSDDLGMAYLSRGEVYEELGRFDEALADFEHVYFLWRDDTPDSGRGWVRAYDALTRAYARAGRWSETVAMTDRALLAASATSSVHPKKVFDLHCRKFEALLAMGRNSEAEKAADAFFAWTESGAVTDRDWRTASLRRVARFFGNTGSAAKRLEVLEVLEKALAPDDAGAPVTPEQMGKAVAVARVSVELGKTTEAVRQADAIRARLPEIADPEAAAGVAIALTDFYDLIDRNEDALALAEKVRELHEQAGMTKVTVRREDLRRISRMLGALRRYKQQAVLTAELLELSRREEGENSPQYVRDLRTHGQLLFRLGDAAASLEALRDALARAERLTPADPGQVESCLSALGFVLTQSDAGSPAEAEAVLRRALELHEKAHGKLQRDAADMRSNLAAALIDLDRLDDAQGVLDQAFVVLRANRAEDSDSAGWANFQQASLLSQRKQWAEALVPSRRSVEIRERIHGPEDARTRFMLRLYVRVAWEAGERQTAVDRGIALLKSEHADHGWTDYRDLLLCAQLASWRNELGDAAGAGEMTVILRNAAEEYYRRPAF